VQNIVAAKGDVFPPLLVPFVRDKISELFCVGSAGEVGVKVRCRSRLFGTDRLKRGFDRVLGSACGGKNLESGSRRFGLFLLSEA